MRCLVAIGLILTSSTAFAAEKWPLAEPYLAPGKLEEGIKVSKARLAAQPEDDQARFGLAYLQILRALETLSADFYKYGFLKNSAFFNANDMFEGKTNPDPQPISDKAIGDMFRKFAKDLDDAATTLAAIDDASVQLPLPVGAIMKRYADYYGPGARTVAPFLPRGGASGRDDPTVKIVIVFDYSDVAWLEAYAHLTLGVIETFNAYDFKELFDRHAHLLFPKVDGPYPFLNNRRFRTSSANMDMFLYVDAASAFTNLRGKLASKERLAMAHQHFQTAVAKSRLMWDRIEAETDDNLEWLPGPKQKSFFGEPMITREMVATWRAMLDQLDQALAGKLLVPFWRGDKAVGVNVKRVFLEPRDLDVIGWVQGPSAVPYLEEGPMAGSDVWKSLQEAFGDNLFFFAFWIN